MHGKRKMSTEWHTVEEELVDLWRDEPLLYSTVSKGYSNQNKKYAAVHRIAQHFDTTGNCNVVVCVYDYDGMRVKFLYISSSLSRIAEVDDGKDKDEKIRSVLSGKMSKQPSRGVIVWDIRVGNGPHRLCTVEVIRERAAARRRLPRSHEARDA